MIQQQFVFKCEHNSVSYKYSSDYKITSIDRNNFLPVIGLFSLFNKLLIRYESPSRYQKCVLIIVAFCDHKVEK